MKRRFKGLVLTLVLLTGLGGCAQTAQAPFVAPYSLSENQEELLSLLNMEDKVMVFSYQGPEEATRLSAHAYVLRDGAWVENGGVSMSREAGDEFPFQGEFALIYHEDRSMDLILNGHGRVSFGSEPVESGGESLSSTWGSITESQAAVLGKEIPVAVFAESGDSSMRSLGPEVYFTPEDAAFCQLAQVVTLEFSQE